MRELWVVVGACGATAAQPAVSSVERCRRGPAQVLCVLGGTLPLVFAAMTGATTIAANAAAAGAEVAPAPAEAAATAAATDAHGGKITIRDDTGATLTLAARPRRIVSLSPGATEMLFAAGAGEWIVATVQGADEPAAAKAIPRIGDSNALNYPRLIELKPDLVVVWEDMTNRLVVDSLRKLELPLYFVRVEGLEDIPNSVRQLGRLIGTSGIANPAAALMEERIAAIGSHQGQGEPLRVFYMLWAEPLYTIGNRHVINDAITRCGGRNIFGDIVFPAPIVEFKTVIERNPDVMLLSAPPITARDWTERWGQYPTIRAVQAQQILPFSDARLERMGPTAIDAVELLCEPLDKARRALEAMPAATAKARAPN